MIKKYLISISLIIGLLLSGCGTPKPYYKSNGEPNSYQAIFIESSSSDTVMLRATGKNTTLKSAIIDSQKSAIWYVLYSSNSALLQNHKQKQKFEIIKSTLFKNSSKYVSYSSGVKSKRKIGNDVVVDVVYSINIKLLREYLESNSILVPTDKLNSSIGMPSISIMRSSTTKLDTKSQVSLDVVAEYLQNRDFEVTVLKENSKIDTMTKKVLMLQGDADPLYLQALSIGSDIYISMNISYEKLSNNAQKASVSLKAFYTATGKQIGASTGYSELRLNSSLSALGAEAANDASHKLLTQIQKSWSKEIKNGKRFKVIVVTTAELAPRVDIAFYKTAKSVCKTKRNFAGQSVYDYTLTCKDKDNALDLLMALQDNYSADGQIYRVSDMGLYLSIKILNSQSDDFELE